MTEAFAGAGRPEADAEVDADAEGIIGARTEPGGAGATEATAPPERGRMQATAGVRKSLTSVIVRPVERRGCFEGGTDISGREARGSNGERKGRAAGTSSAKEGQRS